MQRPTELWPEMTRLECGAGLATDRNPARAWCWLLLLSAIGLMGCAADSPLAPINAPGITELTAPSSISGERATVICTFQLSPRDLQAGRATLRGTGTASPTVTARLTAIDVEAATPTTAVFDRSVPANPDGSVDLVFDGVPVRPVFVTLRIHDGDIAGFRDFRGAANLTSGPNRLVVQPTATGLHQDQLARLLAQVAESVSLLPLAPRALFTLASDLVAQPATTTSDLGARLVARIVGTLGNREHPMVLLSAVESGRTLLLTEVMGEKRVAVASLLSADDVAPALPSDFAIESIRRHADDRPGLTALRRGSAAGRILVRIAAANGAALGRFSNQGPLGPTLSLPDGATVVAGERTSDRNLFVALWPADGSGSADPAPAGTGLTWLQSLTNLASGVAAPTWSVAGLAPVGGDRVLVVLRSLDDELRQVELDLTSGALRGGPWTPTPNRPPTVTITAPMAGSTLSANTQLTVIASATDPDQGIGRVVFYANGNVIGESASEPYFVPWTPTAGDWTLTARAYDRAGLSRTSEPVLVAVRAPVTPPERRFATVIGIDEYAPAYGVTSLHGCVNDASGTRNALLADSERWSADRTALFGNQLATKAAIQARWQQLAADAVAGDLVLYFQSSHGGNSSADWWTVTPNSYLCMHDADYTDVEFAQDLARFRDGVRIIVIIDACYAAGMFKAGSIRAGAKGPPDQGAGAVSKAAPFPFARNVMRHLAELQTRASLRGDGETGKGAPLVGWLTASDYQQTSLAGNPFSLFTRFLLDGFHYGDANGDGQVTFSELFAYAQPKTVSDNPEQTPQLENPTLLAATVATRRGVDLADAAEPDDAPTTARVIALGTPLDRSIAPASDEDWFRFDLGAQASVRITTDGEPGGDTIVGLFDTTGNTRLGLNDDAPDGGTLYSRLEVRNLAAGSYLVRCKAYRSTRIIRSYRLTVALF